MMSVYKIERVTEAAVLGEGPHWDAHSQTLYYVDILKKTLNRFVPKTNRLTTVSVAPKHPSIIVPIEGKENQFVVTLDNVLVVVVWDGEASAVEVLETIATVDQDAPNRFNDGKCDRTGRLWAGTWEVNLSSVDRAQPKGSLYSIASAGSVKRHFGGIHIANGLAWNYTLRKMYYIDSLKRTVDQYDYDEVAGTISNGRVLFDLAKHNIPGFGDGMTIDSDGNLWVAVFGGARVIKISSERPDLLLDTVLMPVKQVTSVVFGGENLDELYVTTASFPNEGEVFPTPENGAVYRVTNLNAKGMESPNYKLQ